MSTKQSAEHLTPYSQSKNQLYALVDVFQKFTDVCGGDKYTLSNILHGKFVVDDPAYSDDHHYDKIYSYFIKTVIPHKIAVYRAGTELLSSEAITLILTEHERNTLYQNLWQHDLSKFSANESVAYAMYNFKNPDPKTKPHFERAWHHHKLNNPHHPEYWMNPNRSGKMEYLLIPDVYIVEMIADWIGAGRTYGSTLKEWLPKNLQKFCFGPSTSRVKDILFRLTGIETQYSLAEFDAELPERNHEVLIVKQ